MPFRSGAQERFMFAEHPSIAKRWLREYGQPRKLSPKVNPESQTNETQGPKKDHVPRLPGTKRDFKGLSPSQSARHVPKRATEAEAMSEGHGVELMPGSRHRELGTPENHKGFTGRDVKVALRKG
jgi:hypothetical protein